ncbi:hypothetical protein DFJ73DRAFT_905819 [Zopfochytrium polystomum]|nr:hypothetical protein DFJ73DRAFT_905819 [Zopfochytrium polystomum]
MYISKSRAFELRGTFRSVGVSAVGLHRNWIGFRGERCRPKERMAVASLGRVSCLRLRPCGDRGSRSKGGGGHGTLLSGLFHGHLFWSTVMQRARPGDRVWPQERKKQRQRPSLPMRILVIGGGVSGPAVALALKRAGHDVEIFDRVLDMLDVPAGQPVGENGLRILKRWGLLDDVLRAGNRCDRYDMRKINGGPPSPRSQTTPAGVDGDLATITILRTALSRILTNAFLLVGIEQPTDGSLGVKAKFRDGSVAYGDILIGADGVHSGVRRCLFPTRTPTKSGFVGFSGVVDDGPSSSSYPTRNLTFHTDNVAGKSGLIMRVSESQLFWVNDWKPLFDLRAERNRVADLAESWGLPDPLQNCVLVGAAKHAMLPFLGQACSVALEDAQVLAELLNRVPGGDPRTAFQMYQDLRYARVRKIAEGARAAGRRMYATSPIGAKVGHLVLKSYAVLVSLTGGNLTPVGDLGVRRTRGGL